MKEKIFCLVRHGQTNWNAERRLQGHTDIPLNEIGKNEAKELGKELKDIPFASCFSSDLKRAAETAKILVDGRGMEVKIDSRLREQYHAEWEGMLWDEYHHIPISERKGVESHESIIIRVFSLLEEILLEDSSEKILIVTHGGLIRTVMNELDTNRDGKRPINVKNTGRIQLAFQNGAWSVKETKGIIY